jgi:hypothetical protein
MRTTLIIALILLTGCGPSMTTRQKAMFGLMVGAQWADYETSRRMHFEDESSGFYEQNPLLDDHPSRDELILFKVGTIGLLWGLGEMWPEHREFFYGVGIVSGGSAAGWNDRLYEKRR